MKRVTATEYQRQPQQKRRSSLLRRFALAPAGTALALLLTPGFPADAAKPNESTSSSIGLVAQVQSMASSSARFFSDVRFLYQITQLRAESAPAQRVSYSAIAGPVLRGKGKIQLCKFEGAGAGSLNLSRAGS